MAEICSCCGDKISFLDVSFDYLEINRDTYKICNKCKKNISYYESGIISVEEVLTEKTDRLVAEYIRNKIAVNEEEKRQNELKRQEKAARREKEIERVNYAKSFNEFYEYDVVTIINKNHGTVDKEEMMKILSDHAKSGWKLHTIYSNELGKNALSVLGLGANSTACEDVLIFERRVQDLEE